MRESREESTIDNRQSAIGARPVGEVRPANDHAVRALRALDEKRLRDAETHIAAIGRDKDAERKEDLCTARSEEDRFSTPGQEEPCTAQSQEGPRTALCKDDLCSASVDRAWKLVLSGLVALEGRDLARAEPLLLQASCLAFIDATGCEKGFSHQRGTSGCETGFSHQRGTSGCETGLSHEPGKPECEKGLSHKTATSSPDSLRVTALALHHVGWIYRRQDRPDEAYRTHLSAYHIRERHGSLEELWETAVELGLDADVARRFGDARRWHQVAVEAGEGATDEPRRKQAIALTNLATSCVESARYEEAVTAARNGRICWRQHDIGAVDAARADLNLGNTLLRQGEALHDRGDPIAAPVLDEAIGWLSTGHEALLAFGTGAVGDAQSCLELKNFGERLRASLELG